MLMPIFKLSAITLIGFIFLFYGGDWLVKGATSISSRFGISKMVIGLTVVAFGTSAPEFFVSFSAGLKGQGSIVIGNVLGSNIANIALILGVASLIKPVEVKNKTLKTDLPWMIYGSFVFAIGYFFGKIGIMLGIIMLVSFFVFLFTRFRTRTSEISVENVKEKIYVSILQVVFGIVLLVWGGNLVVSGAVKLASIFGVSKIVIAATVVAVGTSLPELATSIVASLKGHQDIAVGNAIGSNIFNIFWVLGFCALFFPMNIMHSYWIHFLALILSSVIVAVMMKSGKILTRFEGALLLVGYVLYLFLIF